MDYNIFSNIAPAMPKLSKGTEFVKFAISQASKDMQEVLIPMAIPAVAMKADPEGILAVCDGILVPGGEDLNPWYYGEEPKPQILTPQLSLFEESLSKYDLY
jgi:gamma-glutamyl-gamma-aminobutyrate hydrolase PuuD